MLSAVNIYFSGFRTISGQCMEDGSDAIKPLPHASFFDDTVVGAVNNDTVMGFSVGKTSKIFMLYIEYIQHTPSRLFLFEIRTRIPLQDNCHVMIAYDI